MQFYIGGYTHALDGGTAGSEGIYTCQLESQSGAFGDLVCATTCINPSYLAWGPERRYLYAVKEVFAKDNPAVCMFSCTPEGQLKLAQEVSIAGELPCHLCIDSQGNNLATAQYASGNFSFFRLRANGEMLEPAQHIQHTGHGALSERQAGPHMHYVSIIEQQNTLLAIDLGIDAILGYSIDLHHHTLNPQPTNELKMPAGSGPRHIVFLPGSDTAYVLTELSEEIYQLRLQKKNWEIVDSVPAFETSSGNEGACAAIRISPDQRHLYVSGRNQSQIASMEIDASSHKLKLISRVATGGEWPRDFSISPDGRFVVIANQLSNDLTSMIRDPKTGALSATGNRVTVGSPICVLF